MTAAVSIHPTAEALGAALAGDILAAAGAARGAGRRLLLGCPGGRSLRSTYAALGRAAATAEADLSHLVIVMMDEYVLPAGSGFAPCPADAHFSCRGFGEHEIRARLNAGLPPRRHVPLEQLWLPDPKEPEAYDRRLQAAGGIDLFLLASGASDGHVAFNPPGTPLDSATRVIALAESTRRDNLETFPRFRGLAEVPSHGVSVGLGTIRRLSRAVALVLHGAQKRAAAERVLAAGGFDPAWPATLVHACTGARILLDRSAAGERAA